MHANHSFKTILTIISQPHDGAARYIVMHLYTIPNVATTSFPAKGVIFLHLRVCPHLSVRRITKKSCQGIFMKFSERSEHTTSNS